MPFDQLRTLVMAVIDADDGSVDADADDDPAAEFETQPTTYRPTRAKRATTLDEVIESLLRGN
jgi:hypothetical protein